MLNLCRSAFPDKTFDVRVIKTTGDKFEAASFVAKSNLSKGLFTKELETALLHGEADIAVHSLKDLPTELPPGLKLGAVTQRADIRDVLIVKTASLQGRHVSLHTLRPGAIIGTTSTRRRAQLRIKRPDVSATEVRGNIITRMQKLAFRDDLDGLLLAAAGLERLGFEISCDGRLTGGAVPAGLSAAAIDPDWMLPCVGQGALGIEVRENDPIAQAICDRLNHPATEQCVTAERAFLAGMGGGCASPVAAHAQLIGETLVMRAVSFEGGIRWAAGTAARSEAQTLGRDLAAKLISPGTLPHEPNSISHVPVHASPGV